MAKKQYEYERDGQIDFFNAYNILYDGDNSILIDNTDGIWHGNIFEFKLSINDLNKVLFQAIKYCSKLRIKGQSVPANILLIDLNNTIVYVYHSEDYRDEIQTVYNNSASKDNYGFVAKPYVAKYDYSNMVDSDSVKQLLKENDFMPIDIDEDCIVGWAERYYKGNPKASKGDFLGDETGESVRIIGEIRDPKYFKGLIRPYKGKTNERFKYLMDCLNDRLSKKDLGAFYTPEPYAKKATELVQMAVERVPEGNDYIILDRCAGTGNLEEALIGLYDKYGNSLISHCIVSTYEYYEYKVLQERIGDMVRHIIPPTEANVEYENGRVSNADAMSEEYINNKIIKQYIDNDKCTVILFENPPFNDSSASDNTYDSEHRKKQKTNRKESFVAKEYQKDIKNLREGKGSFRESSNLFIWSGFKYYLNSSFDSYVLFSPIKYYKSIGLVDNRNFISGFGFNRKYFHANESLITCILWNNKYVTKENDSIKIKCFDIDENTNELVNINKDVIVCKTYSAFLPYFDKRKFENDIETHVWVGGDGEEVFKRKYDGISLYNSNILGYLRPVGYQMAPLNRYLTTQIHYNARGFYLRKDNYLIKLPLFCAKCIPLENWYDKEIYFTTADGGDAYTHDNDFLKSCLIYTCLSNQNKCLTFNGSDGRHYQNELCFDKNTIASADLAKYKLDKEEQNLIDLWNKILEETRTITDKDNKYVGDTLGVYQITKEVNTFHREGEGKYEHNVYDHPELNGDLDTLKAKLKEYYNSHIREKMFKYELVK